MELPKRVCESFKSEQKDGGDNLDSGLQNSTKDLGSGSGNNGEEGNSVQEQSDSDTSSGNENLEETQTKIIIQNYGYESEAILKSTACCNLYESFKILFFSTFIVKALF